MWLLIQKKTKHLIRRLQFDQNKLDSGIINYRTVNCIISRRLPPRFADFANIIQYPLKYLLKRNFPNHYNSWQSPFVVTFLSIQFIVLNQSPVEFGSKKKNACPNHLGNSTSYVHVRIWIDDFFRPASNGNIQAYSVTKRMHVFLTLMVTFHRAPELNCFVF